MRKLMLCGWVVLFLLTACDLSRSTTTPETSPSSTATESASDGIIPRASITAVNNTLIPTRTPANAVRLPVSPTLACSGAPQTRLILGERGRVLDDDNRPLNVREDAGTDSDILGRLEILEVFDVLQGPQCGEQYAWYYIRHGQLEGWIAEGDTTFYYVEPYFPG